MQLQINQKDEQINALNDQFQNYLKQNKTEVETLQNELKTVQNEFETAKQLSNEQISLIAKQNLILQAHFKHSGEIDVKELNETMLMELNLLRGQKWGK